MFAAVTAVMAGAATAAPSDYAFEAAANPQGTGTELVVRLRHVPSGTYVNNAAIARVDRHQSFKGPAPFAETRRTLQPDGQGNYRAMLTLSGKAKDYHLVASVPGEPASLHAMVSPTVATAVAMPKTR